MKIHQLLLIIHLMMMMIVVEDNEAVSGVSFMAPNVGDSSGKIMSL